IRFYERRGILKPVRREDSGYRKYDADSLKRLHFIRQAKELGFSLKEIQDLLGLRIRSVETCNRVRIKATEKLEEVQKKISQLKGLEKTMKALISDCENRQVSDCCPILEKMEV
ncbi:MAG: MerR family DNA-binding protein, partial [Pseudobdellovibrionaceae bacterium]